jgi:hypothetical protein
MRGRWTFNSEPRRRQRPAPGRDIISAARQRWRDHHAIAQERGLSVEAAIEQLAAACFEMVRSIQKGGALSTPILWKCVLTGVADTGTLEAQEFCAVCHALSQRYRDFSEPPAIRPPL